MMRAMVRCREVGSLFATSRVLKAAVLGGFMTCAAPLWAADPMVGIRSLAMGDSLRAFANGSEGMLLNPSGIALQREFASSGFYSLRVQSLGHFLHASISDSVTQQYLAMGFYYNYIHESPHYNFHILDNGTGRLVTVTDADIVRTGYEAGAVVAIPFGERFSLGGTLKYGYYSLNSSLQPTNVPADFTYQNPAIDGDHTVDLGSLGHVISFDLGATLRLISQLRIAVVGQNLWAHGRELPARLGFGLSYHLNERVLFAGDAMIDFTGTQTCTVMSDNVCTDSETRRLFRLGAGAEWIAAGRVPLRIGYLFDSELPAHHLSGGIGYLDTESGYGLDLSLRQRLTGGSETVLLIGLRILKQ